MHTSLQAGGSTARQNLRTWDELHLAKVHPAALDSRGACKQGRAGRGHSDSTQMVHKLNDKRQISLNIQPCGRWEGWIAGPRRPCPELHQPAMPHSPPQLSQARISAQLSGRLGERLPPASHTHPTWEAPKTRRTPNHSTLKTSPQPRLTRRLDEQLARLVLRFPPLAVLEQVAQAGVVHADLHR